MFYVFFCTGAEVLSPERLFVGWFCRLARGVVRVWIFASGLLQSQKRQGFRFCFVRGELGLSGKPGRSGRFLCRGYREGFGFETAGVFFVG